MIKPSEASMTVRRTFDAPRERVWEALTHADQVDQWWGPDGFTTTTDEMAVEPGGVWLFVMVGPDSEEYQNRVKYDEVGAPERLGYRHGSPADPEQFRVTITLEDVGEGKTELTMESRFPSPAALDDALKFDADDGAEQTLGRLAEYLANGGSL